MPVIIGTQVKLVISTGNGYFKVNNGIHPCANSLCCTENVIMLGNWQVQENPYRETKQFSQVSPVNRLLVGDVVYFDFQLVIRCDEPVVHLNVSVSL